MRLDPDLFKKTGVFALVSGELVGSVGGAYLLGNWLDQKFHTAPVLASGLAIAGLGYAVWRVKKMSETWFRKPNGDGK